MKFIGTYEFRRDIILLTSMYVCMCVSASARVWNFIRKELNLMLLGGLPVIKNK